MNELLHIVSNVGLIGLKTVGVILLTDLASGVIHWLEDSYGKPTWPFFGKRVIVPNIEHHFFPRKFTKSSTFSRNTATLTIAILIGLIVASLGAFNVWWALALGIGAFANEIHSWAHRSPRENGKLITALQKTGILQGVKHHGKHHTDPKNRTYCTITNYVNPFLDGIKLFQRLEKLIEKTTGITRRIDESVKVPKKKGCAGCPCARNCGCVKNRGTRTGRHVPRVATVAER